MFPGHSARDVRTLTQYYVDDTPIKMSMDNLPLKYVNAKAQTDCFWFDAQDPPETREKSRLVVLAYRIDEDKYEVCAWDGQNFICVADQMPFLADMWTYLPEAKNK